MATLADSFLADLEDLSDDEPMAEGLEDMDQDQEDELDNIEELNYDDLRAVAKLTSDPHYQDVMQRVRDAVSTADMEADNVRTTKLEDDPTYKLLVECNKLAIDIDNEVVVVHNFIRDKYRLKFPELESLVHHAVDYARVVKRIGNEMDLTLVDLDDLLPAATIMVVTVTATTTSGKPLTTDLLSKCMEGCDMVLSLEDDRQQIIWFVESKMHSIAPNLSAAIGSEVAARLMGVAGGLIALSTMPSCNIQVLGAKRKNLAGFSSATVQPHQGFLYNSSIMQQAPPALRQKAVRLIAAKCALLARIDAYGQDPTGQAGIKMRDEEILRKLEKWQEPPPAKQPKPLPAPDAEVKKRRGGKRLRKTKERYGLTDMRKAANRMKFNEAEEEYIDGDEVVGLGVLGKEGTGRLRIVASQQKVKLNAKQQKKYKNRLTAGSGEGTNGLSSSLAFTPVQGIELVEPVGTGTDLDKSRSGTESYFSDFGGFRSLSKKPRI
eukprot:jgi/Chrzof1/771/Cz01g28080.t1